jgi:hypothetical protein
MMNTVGHHLYFMMLCVGMADGYTSDEERERCKTRASEQVARVCQRDGWDKYDIIEKKEQDILKEAAAHLLFSIQTGSLWENFAKSVRAMPPSLDYNQNELNDLYDAMKSVAEADGTINIDEHNVLEFVYAEWGLVRYGELHRL